MIGFGDAARVGPHVVVVRNAVEPAVQRLLAGYGRVVLGGGGFVPDRANHSTVLRGDPLADALLDDATDETARLCGCERLFPLHGEFRLFRGFAVLDDPVHNEDVRLFLLADRADGARVPTIAVEGLDRAVEIGERDAVLVEGPAMVQWSKGLRPSWTMHLAMAWTTDRSRLYGGRPSLGRAGPPDHTHPA